MGKRDRNEDNQEGKEKEGIEERDRGEEERNGREMKLVITLTLRSACSDIPELAASEIIAMC